MSTFIDSLNLRPQEKRLIGFVGVVAFVVLNLLFVRPHFKDYSSMKLQLQRTLFTNKLYSDKIAMDKSFQEELKKLQKQEGGSSTANLKSEIQLQKTVSEKAHEANVNVKNYDPVSLMRLGTNVASDFFESQSIRITVEAMESNLVTFLVNVGDDPAMIRVQELDLHPLADANRDKLAGQITLTADYKKNKETATKPASTKPAASAPKPAATATIPAAPATKPAAPAGKPATPATKPIQPPSPIPPRTT
ncbi:MAG: hypothetical protein ABSA47_04715, partial [Verrucomicrobiota bacterium]